MDAFGGRSLKEVYDRDSPCRSANYPQLRLEPLLLEYARTLPLAKINYHHEVQSFEQDADGVTATVLERGTGETYQVRARYMIAADGGRFVGPTLGIPMDGIDRLFDMVRSEEHTSELQSLMRISYAVFCLKKKKQK